MINFKTTPEFFFNLKGKKKIFGGNNDSVNKKCFLLSLCKSKKYSDKMSVDFGTSSILFVLKPLLMGGGSLSILN